MQPVALTSLANEDQQKVGEPFPAMGFLSRCERYSSKLSERASMRLAMFRDPTIKS